MKKVKLNLEALAVESFATDEAAGSRGTVLARSDTNYEIGGTCGSEYNTYYESCLAGQCPNSWDQPCGGGTTRPPYKPLTGGGGTL
jgi:hypothetical protein